jgi:hypothetical protein
MRQAQEQGKPKTEIREWDDTGALLLDKVSSGIVHKYYRPRDELTWDTSELALDLPPQHTVWSEGMEGDEDDDDDDDFGE